METNQLKKLTDLKIGQGGIIVDITGGQGARRRMEALGLRIGKSVKKISGMFMDGPITVQVGPTQIGVGHGLASKIMIEVAE